VAKISKISTCDSVWECPIFDASGYANAARHILLGLNEMECVVRLNHFRNWSLLDIKMPQEEKIIFQKMMGRPLKGSVPCVMFKIPDAYDFQWGTQSTQIGFTMFEVDGIPAKWAGILNQCDEVWVPSTFNKTTFAKSGVEKSKIHVMPLGCDTEHFKPGVQEPIKIINKKGFNFLSVFQWSIRKGWDILLDAYLEEFSAKEDVALVLKTYEARPGDKECENIIRDGIQSIKKMIGKKKDGFPTLLWYKDLIPEGQMPSLYEACDCFVLPTRGEGWNLPGIEAMSMELPVITTRWSAHLDFMNDKNSYLIDVEAVNDEHSGMMHRIHPGYYGYNWAKPSIPHTRLLMRHAFENREEIAKVGKKARKDIVRNWTWNHACRKIRDRLCEVTCQRNMEYR